MNSQMKSYMGQSPERSLEQELLSQWNWGASLSASGYLSQPENSSSKVLNVCTFDLANPYLGIYPKMLKDKHTELYHKVICLSIVYNSKNWKPLKFPVG